MLGSKLSMGVSGVGVLGGSAHGNDTSYSSSSPSSVHAHVLSPSQNYHGGTTSSNSGEGLERLGEEDEEAAEEEGGETSRAAKVV